MNAAVNLKENGWVLTLPCEGKERVSQTSKKKREKKRKTVVKYYPLTLCIERETGNKGGPSVGKRSLKESGSTKHGGTCLGHASVYGTSAAAIHNVSVPGLPSEHRRNRNRKAN